ncbi:pre-rRNA-processing protein Tsr2p [[Candida] jaroonii]|uniref:Pre-rRNA-processing protein Tsr2p n=1 Tax=[Candida] jaroonii TaxID=467808 RepID=A0ACA9YFG1_9ASCO|nr:pre-rRNA-processing protein Tsr2p [[Candida] jaroonii]
MNIDPTDYVESDSVLRFSDTKLQAHFELGVCMAIYKWEELATAVDNSWGGPNSADKRDWISGIIIELFSESKIVDIQLIEETLLYAMVDEFDTEIDNDSALEIAALIMKFFKDVSVGKFDDIDALYGRWKERQANRVFNRVQVISDPNNPSDDEDDEEEEVHSHTHEHDEMNVDEPNEPVVDDDGFTLVQKRRR